jgi:DNA primase
MQRMIFHLDLKRLKQAVTIEQVLGNKGLLDRLRRRGTRLVGPCPLHDGDNPNAFVVDTERNIWRCFTGCAAGGDLVELARRLDDGTFAGAARCLARLAGSAPPLRPAPTKRPHTYRRFRPFTRRLSLDPSASFLLRKGISPETARRFEVGVYLGSGMLSGCIAVRLLDHRGRPLGYAGRRLDNSQAQKRGKWVFPPRFPKSKLLYGYHQARDLLQRGVVVVECPWGVLRLAQLAIPAVALLGTSLSANQRAILLGLPKVVLLLDGDQAGRRAARYLRDRLPNAKTVGLTDGLDPDDLSDEDLFSLLTQTQRLPF